MNTSAGSCSLSHCTLDYAAATDRGRVRKKNEDGFLVLPDQPVFCVADGAGGHVHGAEASRLTLESIRFFFTSHASRLQNAAISLSDDTLPLPVFSQGACDTLLESAILHANTTVFQKNTQHKMASTIVACHFDETRLHIAHIGDSRLYLFRSGEMRLLTEDHSLVNLLFKKGEISKEQMRNHPKKNVITRAVGTEKDIRPDVMTTDYLSGDYYLLCSDGLSTMMDDREIHAFFLQKNDDITECCRSFIDEVNARGGRDNITVMIIRVH